MRGAAFSVATALACVLLALLPAEISAQDDLRDDARQARERLESLAKDIADLVQKQRRDERERGTLVARLRETEQALSDTRQALRATAEAIDGNRVAIAALAVRQAELRDALKTQQGAVRRELRAAYRSGDAGELKLLLGGDDPQDTARLLAYYRYLIGARSEILHRYESTLTQLDASSRELDAREERLAKQRRTQQTQRAELETLRTEREAVLAQADERLAAQSATIAEREAERADLETLLPPRGEALLTAPNDETPSFRSAAVR